MEEGNGTRNVLNSLQEGSKRITDWCKRHQILTVFLILALSIGTLPLSVVLIIKNAGWLNEHTVITDVSAISQLTTDAELITDVSTFMEVSTDISIHSGKLRKNKITFHRDEIIFLNREDGSENFQRKWADYKAGFGNLNGEYWLGLECLHQITSYKDHGLSVMFGDFEGNVFKSRYKSIVVGPESGGYKLSVSGWSSSISEPDRHSLTHPKYGANNMKFSTTDRDNDKSDRYNCAETYGGGGWWYHACGHSRPTGQYRTGGQIDYKGINWYSPQKSLYSYKFMKLTLTNI